MYRRYYSYNDMPTVPKPAPPAKAEEKCVENKEKEILNPLFENGKIFGKFNTDDILLIVVIFILLMDDCDDLLLLLALGFIFLNS